MDNFDLWTFRRNVIIELKINDLFRFSNSMRKSVRRKKEYRNSWVNHTHTYTVTWTYGSCIQQRRRCNSTLRIYVLSRVYTRTRKHMDGYTGRYAHSQWYVENHQKSSSSRLNHCQCRRHLFTKHCYCAVCHFHTRKFCYSHHK